MNPPNSPPLFDGLPEPPADGQTFINGQLWFVDQDGFRVVFCRHEPIFRVALTETQHLRLVAVNLRLSELATQEEMARAFGHSVATQRRWERRFQTHGLHGLDERTPPGRSKVVPQSQVPFVRLWFQAGLSFAAIGRHLGVSPHTVRRLVQHLGLQRPAPAEPPLLFDADLSPETSAASPPAMPSDTTPNPDPAPIVEPSPLPTVATAAVPPTTPSLPAAPDTSSLSPLPEVTVPPENTGGSSAEVPLQEPPPPAPASPGPANFTIDLDPANRSGDRFLARQGLLADAVPLFGNAERVPGAGVLLAVPLLDLKEVVPTFQEIYGQALRPAFYGLRTIVVAIVLWALLRIKRPEQLKEYPPRPLGQILGLDRAPEVKTLRRKLTRLATHQQAGRLMAELARRRVQRQNEVLAFFYFDGHVRIYSGKEPLAKAKKSQQALPRPASTDIWVHEGHGLPLLVVTTPMNAQLTQVLEEIVAEVKPLLPPGVRLTALFDRGGFSPKLFRRLIAAGVDIITYRKGKKRPLPQQVFQEVEEILDGDRVHYRLHDQARVRVGRLRSKKKRRVAGAEPEYLWMRQVTILRSDDRQTQILTNRSDLSAVAVAYRLFGRWRQENFFKYMDEEFALNALVEYGVDEVSAETDRPNPRWLRLRKQLKKARAEVAQLQAELGQAAATNEEQQRPTMRGFKIAQAELRKELATAEARVARLRRRLSCLPKRVLAHELKLKRLKTEKRLLVDSLKMVAYEIETDLLGRLAKYYARTLSEGRTLLQALFRSAATLEVAGEELRVTLEAQSSPHRTAAVAGLCEEMNQLNRVFPGTNLRLRFAVATE